MSESEQAAPSYKVTSVLDTRLEATGGSEVQFVLPKGAKYTQYNKKNSIDFSNQGGNWILDPTGDRTCRDPRIMMHVPTITVTINATNGGTGSAKLVTSDNFGLKQWALTRCQTAVNHQINSASYPFNPYKIIDGIARLNSQTEVANFFQGLQPDLVDSYANATGSAIHPLGPYSNSAAGEGIYKTRTPAFTVTNNTYTAGQNLTTTVVISDYYEPLVTYYTNIGKEDGRAYYGIVNETVNMQFCGNLLQNMIAFFPPSSDFTINSMTLDLGGTADLYTIILTPPDDIIELIPRESVYQHPIYNVFEFGSSACAPGVTLPFNQTVNFNTIPDKILIFAKVSPGSYAVGLPDKYLAVQSMTLTFDSQQPCFASASPRQIWEVCTRNGVCMPWQCWDQQVLNSSLVAGGATPLYGCGAVLCISPAYDLSVRTGAGVGSSGRYTFNPNINFVNKTSTTFPAVSFYIVAINEGIMERDGSVYRDYQQAFPVDIMEHASLSGFITRQEYTDTLTGNSFLSGGSIKDLARKALSWADENPEKVYKAAKEVAKVARKTLGHGGKTLQEKLSSSVPRTRLFYQ